MKFALIGPASPWRGGIAQHTTALGRELSREHEVLVVTFSRQYPRLLFPGSSQKVQVNPSRDALLAHAWIDSLNPWTWKKTTDRIAEFAPEAVVMQWWHPYFAGLYASLMKRLKKLSRARLILLCHNVFPHERLPSPMAGLERALIAHAFKRADGFLVQSERLGDEVRQFRPSAPQRQVAHPIYDFFSQWDPGPGSRHGSEVHLLFFGKVRRYKGLEVFLEALHYLGGKLPFKATIAGEFYLDPRPFHRLARGWNLEERLRWEDRYVPDSEVPGLFREADLVVLPYLEATQSGVVPLAYQFDVPVIASDVGGLSELVVDGETGFLCPPGDAACLARAITRFFDEDRGQEFRQNIASFRDRLSWQNVVDSILDLSARIDSTG